MQACFCKKKKKKVSDVFFEDHNYLWKWCFQQLFAVNNTFLLAIVYTEKAKITFFFKVNAERGFVFHLSLVSPLSVN